MTNLQNVEIDNIKLSQTESQKARRASFDKAGLAELAASVKADGVVVPIIVRPLFKNGAMVAITEPGYALVAGERRYIAAGMAKLDKIPAVVRELTDEQVVALQLIENLQREGLHPMHEAESYHALVHDFGHPIEDVIVQVGKSRTYVYGRMKLLSLSKKCRKAFYDGKISASIAEKLARIPVEKTQEEALVAITRDSWSYRQAAEIIRDRFMLKLAEASFPLEDPELNSAGPCSKCPKRTGNQPELFGDVKSADVCTDPVCFAAKGRAYGQRVADFARQRGQTVLTGKDAKKVVPNGIHVGGHHHVAGGFRSIDDTEYVGSSEKKIGKLIGPDVERTLVVDGETGRTLEVVPEAEVRKALGERGVRPGSVGRGASGAEKKAKLAKRVTFETYVAVRPKLKPPSLFEIAGSLFRRLEHDATKILCKVRDFDPPTRTEQYRGKVTDYAAIGKGLEKMPDAELQLFINDCIYVRELMYGDSLYRDVGIPKIAELAKKHRIDVTRIRTALAPKTKKKVAKKTKRKKAA